MADLPIWPAVYVLLALITVKFLRDAWLARNKRNTLPLPPGPKRLPLVGNIADLPAAGTPEYQHWLKHKDTYGPISSITVLGQTMIIIHDKNIAMELMEKRHNVHSGRPKMRFGFDMCGWSNAMAGLQNNATHRLLRKYTYQQLGSKTTVSRYHKTQDAAVGRFLWRVNQDNAANLTQHLKTEACELILKVVYDYTIEPVEDDPLVDLVDKAMAQFAEATVPGRWAVDIMPFLEHLPEWIPGTGFKRTARAWKKTLMNVANIPYDFSKQQTSASFVTKSINQAQEENRFTPTDENAIKWAAASMYLGGADTSVSTMNAFFLAMTMFPEVQAKAQEEIDRVIGTSRLPTAEDRDNLPYINAIVEESQRWHPIAPMGLPHATDKEDTIDGYRIPKDSLLLPAIWWFTRDPSVYHDPETFEPERFLAPYNEPSATSFTFGFGRRICPGRALADASLFLTFAQSLAVFNIKRQINEQGHEIRPVHGFGSGIIAYPDAFGVRVTSRSRKHEELIENVVKQYPWQESDARYLDLKDTE